MSLNKIFLFNSTQTLNNKDVYVQKK